MKVIQAKDLKKDKITTKSINFVSFSFNLKKQKAFCCLNEKI